jgi:Protein required for attachment to host cells
MITSSLIILADRGGLKAYAVAETPTRGPSLRLVDDFQITGWERKLPFKAGSSQRRVLLTRDWPSLETETNCRVCQRLAKRIGRVVKTERLEGWSFAAEPAIHKVVVDLLPAAIRERIVEHVPSDLMKTKSAKLRSHFRSLRPIRSAAIPRTPARPKRAPRRRTRLKTSAKP